MSEQMLSLLSGEVLEEDVELTLADLCRSCCVSAERIFELVDEGVVEPLGREPEHWRFSGVNILRVRCAIRLERDLGVNAAGAALAMDLMAQIENMRTLLTGKLTDHG